jgi:hypothetical protein
MNAPLSKTILGDLLAERDSKMLDVAFFETPEYKSLTAALDHTTAVGRRGTGKSALFYRLAKFWTAGNELILLKLAPEEIEIFGLRPYADQLGARFNLIRAYYRLAWRYALSMEIAAHTPQHYKSGPESSALTEAGRTWLNSGPTPTHRLRSRLKTIPPSEESLDGQIADLAVKLGLASLEFALKKSLHDAQQPFFLLIDDLDEGYEPDEVGIGLVCGVIHAAIDVQARYPNIKSLVFLRDNIFRAVARLDPDYSRSIEGQVLRLHWDEFNLFSMICSRLRVAFNLSDEEDLKVWNKCTARNLQGKSGFRQCLQLTLYRPRDLISLLNSTFYHALSQGRTAIVDEDVEETAKEISQTRLDDLFKEYKYVLPSLEPLVNCFVNASPERSYLDACALIQTVLKTDKHPPLQQQDLAIIKSPEQAIRALYSVGFLGLQRPSGASFIFCHDGNSPAVEFTKDTKLLIHPCYWMALNLTRNIMQADEAAEINDEYDIEVTSQTPEIRHQNISRLIESLNSIPCGDTGASGFEKWCHGVLTIVFAGALRNVELKPNKDATQRRDIVGTNLGETDTWKRILEQYSSSQVIFEVKNYATDIGPTEFRQMNSYLSLDYGNCGFIITRSPQADLQKGKELDWVREIFFNHHKLIIKLTADWLIAQLHRLDNPVKHNAPDEVLGRLLDRYIRVYLSLGASPGNKAT